MEALNELREASENNDTDIRDAVKKLVRTYYPAEEKICQATGA